MKSYCISIISVRISGFALSPVYVRRLLPFCHTESPCLSRSVFRVSFVMLVSTPLLWNFACRACLVLFAACPLWRMITHPHCGFLGSRLRAAFLAAVGVSFGTLYPEGADCGNLCPEKVRRQVTGNKQTCQQHIQWRMFLFLSLFLQQTLSSRSRWKSSHLQRSQKCITALRHLEWCSLICLWQERWEIRKVPRQTYPKRPGDGLKTLK